uniref:Alternative protein SLC12A7 n=1 Tax=Homo sapiens TaxID=9606 RepID=L8E7W0_HUMAN|nr:alternative protein SLC12A7 [Homo sapiens]
MARPWATSGLHGLPRESAPSTKFKSGQRLHLCPQMFLRSQTRAGIAVE